MKLSHTKIETFKQCGEKFNLHYNERLRETRIHSPLFFGSAFDTAIETLLLNKKNGTNDDAYAAFDKRLSFTTLNNEVISIKSSTAPIYLKADFDVRLLNDEDKKQLDIDPEAIADFYEDIRQTLQAELPVSTEDLIEFNKMNWLALRRKGHLMIKSFQEHTLDRIKEVISTQRAVTLTNDEGDSIVGFIDLIVKWEDDSIIVFDIKTSSRKYGERSAIESQQLTIYGEHEGIHKVGFIVLLKTLKSDRKTKEVTIAEPQIIISDLDPTLQEKVFAEIAEIGYKIKTNQFEKNWDGCFSFGRKCQYYNYCRSGSMDKLIRLTNNES
jgi:RecB family exonuclease